MVSVLTWVFWLSFAVIILSELKFWDVLRGGCTQKTQENENQEKETKDS